VPFTLLGARARGPETGARGSVWLPGPGRLATHTAAARQRPGEPAPGGAGLPGRGLQADGF